MNCLAVTEVKAADKHNFCQWEQFNPCTEFSVHSLSLYTEPGMKFESFELADASDQLEQRTPAG